MHCINCTDSLKETEVRWAYNEPYCEDCFDDLFDYCIRCDNIITRDEAIHNEEGESYCTSCWDDSYDDDAPENPDVYESDRETIITLSRNWLDGKLEYKRLISINRKDYFLKELRNSLGSVDEPLYVYGLKDRDEYQMKLSPNIKQRVEELLRENNIFIKILEDKGINRMGISYSLRAENLSLIIQIIKDLTQKKKEEEPLLQQ